MVGAVAAVCMGLPAVAEAKPDKTPDRPAKKVSKKKRKKAKKYTKKGLKRFKKKRYQDALDAFALAYELDPKHDLLFNMGRCYERLGNISKALDYIGRFLEQETDDEVREDANSFRKVLLKRMHETHALVRLAIKPDKATFQVAGSKEEKTGEGGAEMWLEPGVYTIRAEAPGLKLEVTKLTAVAGKTHEVSLELTPPPPPKPPPPPEPAPEPEQAKKPEAEPPPPPKPAEGGPGVATWASLGIGAALLGGGAFFGLQSSAAVDRYEALRGEDTVTLANIEKEHDDAQSAATTSHILYATGALAVGVGATLWLLSGGEAEETGVRWVIGPAGVGMALGFSE